MRVWELAEQLSVECAVVLDRVRTYDPYVRSQLSTVPELALRAILADPPPRGRRPRPEPAWAHRHSIATPLPQPGDRPRHRPGRRPGPRRVTFEPPYEEGDDGYSNDPTADLRNEPALSTRDVANYFGVSMATVRKWVERGYLTPTGKFGTSHIFDTETAMASVRDVLGRRQRPGYPRRLRRLRRAADPATRPLSGWQLDRMVKVFPDRLLQTREAATLLGLSPATIRAWVHRGHLTPSRASRPRQLLFRLDDVYAASRRT